VVMSDEELERYLAEFQPRPVRALEISPRIKNPWTPRLVAAALVIFVSGVSLWHLRQETKRAKDLLPGKQVSRITVLPQSELNAIALTRLALENHEHFEAVLADKSRRALPNFQWESSTLHILAKE